MLSLPPIPHSPFVHTVFHTIGPILSPRLGPSVCVHPAQQSYVAVTLTQSHSPQQLTQASNWTPSSLLPFQTSCFPEEAVNSASELPPGSHLSSHSTPCYPGPTARSHKEALWAQEHGSCLCTLRGQVKMWPSEETRTACGGRP